MRNRRIFLLYEGILQFVPWMLLTVFDVSIRTLIRSRRATIGSTCFARRAGKYAASSATIEMARMAVINVGGSDGVRPKSCVPTRRVAAIVAGTPRSTPIPDKGVDRQRG